MPLSSPSLELTRLLNEQSDQINKLKTELIDKGLRISELEEQLNIVQKSKEIEVGKESLAFSGDKICPSA